jgi:signal peptidase II
MLVTKKKKRDIRQRLWPLILSGAIMIVDQVTKAIVVRTVPVGHGVSVIGDFFRVIHVQNPAIAFSIGRGLAEGTRRPLFAFLPLVVVVIVSLYYFLTRDEITRFQRWCFGALIGGGLGNYIDRIFRPEGVVDFLDFKFYGILGMERWPTFNVADMSLVISGILLFISFLLPTPKKTEAPKQTQAPKDPAGGGA